MAIIRDIMPAFELFQPATIVHDHHLSGLRLFQSFEEYVDAAQVPHRTHPACTMHTRRNRL